MEYLGGTLSSMMTTAFFVFAITAIGYLLGGIKIKGVSLGTAGVLVAALIFGMIAHNHPYITVGSKQIVLFLSENTNGLNANKQLFSTVLSLGTTMFITAVGLTAGPKFFRSFNRKTIAYVIMGIFTITIGSSIAACIIKIGGLDASLATGLFTGALTSTPGLSSAKELAPNTDAVTAGYGIAYLFGVIGKVLFIQLIPKILRVNIDEERKNFVAANTMEIKPLKGKLKAIDTQGFFAFALAAALGAVIGALKIPGINISLGASGGSIVAGLIIGHFGHIGLIDCRIKKETLNFFRELGLVFFLVGAGVQGGTNFMTYVSLPLFLMGATITLTPMILGFILGKFVFKMKIFNNLGSITGGMTSTPALGALIRTAGTDEVVSAYAATYPVALVMIVIASKILVSL